MKPLRFLTTFLTAYALSTVTLLFFVFSAQYTGRSVLVFVGLLLSFVYTFLFSWLYFRGIKGASWRHRSEAILVWMGLVFILDYIVMTVFYHAKLSDLGMMSVMSYGIFLLLLFISAYLTTNEHPKLSASAPNLMATEPEQTKKQA